MAKQLRESKMKRDQALFTLDRLQQFIDNIGEMTPSHFFEIQSRLDRLPVIFNQFEEAQINVEIHADDPESESSIRIRFEDKFYFLSAKLKEILSENDQKNFKERETPRSESSSSSTPLSTVRIHPFNGEYSRWVEFRDSFIAIVHRKTSLTNIEKFFHLKSCLSEEVLETIRSIPVTNDNYPIAWQQLIDRYEKSNLISNHHVNLILNSPNVAKESSKDLRNLYNCIRNNLDSLKTLGVAVEQWDLLLIPIITAKLDSITRREWENFTISQKNSKISDLLALISNRSEFLERLNMKPTINQFYGAKQIQNPNAKSSKVLLSVAQHCENCKGNHPIFKCDPFLKLPIEERIKKIKELHLCLNCLKPGHFVKECTRSQCVKCKEKHNTLLHRVHINTFEKPSEGAVGNQSVQLHAYKSLNHYKQILLPTALVLIADSNNKFHKCKALLDTGAMSNFITQELSNTLKLPTKRTNCSISGLGHLTQTAQSLTKISFKSCFHENSTFSADCFVIEKITSNLPLLSFSTQNCRFPNHIQLADPSFNESGPIDLLLGADIVWSLWEDGKIKIPQTGLTLCKSKLGWVVGGHFSDKGSKFRNQKSINCLCVQQDNLDKLVQRFWEAEEVNTKPSKSAEDDYCETLFEKTLKRSQEGKFIVKIPFKPNITNLGDSKKSALKRFFNIEKKLIRNNELYEEYRKTFNEYLTMGHMKQLTEGILQDELAYYIPHHAVIRNDSMTTKTRIVFDASMRTTTGISLNEAQYIGPAIQNDIFNILSNFRIHKYVLCGDISKMYRMIWLDDAHKRFHRIFWRDNPHEEICCFELQTVTFGTASAPFLAIRCLHQLAIENEKSNPRAAKLIKNNFYVDDLLCGADTVEEIIQIQHELFSILKSAGFVLRKWRSNSPEVYEKLHLNPDLECNVLQFGSKESKTLGITWDSKSDKILYAQVALTSHNHPTKRMMLSDLAKLFDPLGLLGPIIIVGKLFIQKLWQEKVSWDEELSESLINQWLLIKAEIEKLNVIKLNRRVLIDKHIRVELHGFCDASEKAYGACVFIKSIDNKDRVQTHLLGSKSRVAPLKTISLPRLELWGAVLLAQLVHKVAQHIDMRIDNITYWTDSTIVLCWIRGDVGRWTTFVSNRVGEIQRLTNVKNWYHVSSRENPADLLSRGSSVSLLKDNQLWWSGPQWLKGHVLVQEETYEYPETVPEQKSPVLVAVQTDPDNIINKYSNFTTLVRVTAYCLRFIKNSKRIKASRDLGELTIEEVQNSSNVLVRIMQSESFPEEYHQLSNKKPIHRKSNLLSLNPFLDEHMLIRVGGRLEHGQINFDKKHPIILAPKHQLTKLIIKELHFKHFHCGPTVLLSFIRERYWPIHARKVIKEIIRNCKICFAAKPEPGKYLMGQLPAVRITQCFPFQNVGVDYAGPILLRDRKSRNYKTLKSYICLFVCLATKAIHLELVSELTTDGFLSCLKRFISRRGKPSHIYSDNGKNFVGANNELKTIYRFWEDQDSGIHKFCTQEKISWHFIPARSPTFGGIWEAGIKKVKYHLTRCMGNTKFHFEDLSTLLCQIEAVLNSRPLTPLTSDPADLLPLTPAHFLIGRTLTEHPELNATIPTSRYKYYKYFQEMLQHFWNRWSREYIGELQTRTKWKQNSHPEQAAVKIGRLVLVKDENTPPLQWPLGRIVELHPGQDGIVRTVSLKLRDSTVKRSLSKICFLPNDQ